MLALNVRPSKSFSDVKPTCKSNQLAGTENIFVYAIYISLQTGAAGSVVDLVLEGGVLILYLGQNRVDSQMVSINCPEPSSVIQSLN